MAPDNRQAKDNRRPRVAVIAIHGVANQVPGETGRAVACLIQQRGDVGNRAITEQTVNIEVEPVESPMEAPGLGERIAEYKPKPEEAVYRSTVCSTTLSLHDKNVVEGNANANAAGEREAHTESGTETDIDIFEMYWADLSGIRNNLFHTLAGAYRLFISMCEIAMDASGALHKAEESICSNVSQKLTDVSVAIVSRVLPVLNMYLASLFVFQVPFWVMRTLKPNIQDGDMLVAHRVFATLTAAILVAYVVGSWAKPIARRVANFHFTHTAFGCFNTVVLVVALASIWSIANVDWIGVAPLVIATWLPAATAVILVCRKLNDDIPEITVTAYHISAFLLGVILGRFALTTADDWSVPIAGMRIAELLVLLVVVCAVSYYLCVVGLVLIQGVSYVTRPLFRYRRLNWTVVIALLIPGIALAIANTGLWRALEIIASRHLPSAELVTYQPDFPRPYDWISSLNQTSTGLEAHPPDSSYALNAMPNLLIDLVSIPVVSFVVLSMIWLACMSWLFIPCFRAESKPESIASSEMLGATLTASLRQMGRLTLIVFLLSFLFYFPPVFGAIWAIVAAKEYSLMSSITAASSYCVWMIGLLFLAMITGLMQRLVPALTAITDLAADVSNWLRQNPRDNNPASKITARYVSLLRYVFDRKDTDGAAYYDGIVIVAHSLGTVITADVLQHLKEYEKANRDVVCRNERPIYLFTFGSPLKQLLNVRLPHLYDWVAENNSEQDGQSEAALAPDPSQLLGVREWVNAYTSGDYVGRSLWRDAETDSTWDTGIWDARMRREFCVGVGGHTRYWSVMTPDSSSARQIAREMVRLVQLATANE